MRPLVASTCIAAMVLMAGCSTGQEAPPTSEPAPTTGGESSAPAGDAPVLLYYIQKQGDQQYFVDQAKGATDMAAELGNVEVRIVNVSLDANKAISEVDAAIANKAQGIILVAPDQAIGPQVADKTSAAGIPLLASDDTLLDASGAEVPFVGFDGTQMGESVGEKAAELFQAAGWTKDDTKIMSITKLDLSVCMQRVEGAIAKFKSIVGEENTPEEIVVGTNADVESAINKAGATLTANQDVKNWVVWGCNDESQTGAVTALQNAGVAPANIIGVGLGAYLTCKDWVAGIESGNRAALYISGVDVGRAAVKVMVDNVRNGVPLPPKTIAETHMVDASNFEAQGVVCT